MNCIEEVCEKYPNIRMASASDNQEILDFLKSVSMSLKDGSLDFMREPNYFKLHSLQGIISKTALFRNKDGSLSGIGVITSVKGLYQGKEIVWAYLSDLRFSPKMDKVTKLQFRPWYSDLVKNFKTLQDFHYPQYLLSIVLDDNEVAKKNLLNRKNPIVYRPIYKYQTRAIFGKIPNLRPSLYKVSKTQDIESLKNFIASEQGKLNFSLALSDIELKLKVLGQTWKDFMVIKNQDQEIIAASLLTSDNDFRKTVIKFESKKMKLIGTLSTLLGRPSIPESGILKTSILAFATFRGTLSLSEKENLRNVMLAEAWSLKSTRSRDERDHVLIATENQKTKKENSLIEDGLLSQFVPGTVYQIIHKDDYKKANLLRGFHNNSPCIETSFL